MTAATRAPVIDETDGERAAGQRVAERLGEPQGRAALERVGDRSLISRALRVAGSRRQVGEPRFAQDLAGAGEADDDGDLHARLGVFDGRRQPAGAERARHVLDRVEDLRLIVLRRTVAVVRGACRPRTQQQARCQRSCPQRTTNRLHGSVAVHLISAATCMRTIRSGLATGSPRLILSTFSMPATTSPITVYLPLRNAPSANMM